MEKVERRFWRVGLLPLILLSVLFVVFASVRPASAAINGQINFQGKLTNPDGTNVTDGNYSILFTIYEGGTELGGGTVVWDETQTVAVDDGVFRVALGSVDTTLPTAVNFGSDTIYLSLKVGADPEMSPRVRFTASPYAFNASRLGGLASGSFVQLGQISGATGQTDASTNSAIFINKTSTGNQLQLQSGGVNVFTVANAGDLTFGQNAAKTISVQQTSTNAAGRNLTVAAGQGGAGASANAGGNLVLQAGAGGGTNGAGGNLTLAGGAGSGSGATGSVIVKNPANSTTAFVVQNATSNNIFTVNTTNQQVSVTAAAAPAADLVSISNVGQPVTTAGANALGINYVGGNAAVEASGLRIDYTPGGTSGGTWSGMRIVANATGAAAGVNEYGLKIEGPSSPGAGNEVGINITSGWDIGIDIGSGGLQLADQSEPATPAAGELRIYAKSVAGRLMLRQKGPSGVATPLQPSFFQNSIAMCGTLAATTITEFGTDCATVANGTATRTITNTEQYGTMMNIATGTTTGNDTGIQSATGQWFRGSQVGSNGFFFASRVGTPDNTSLRTYVGLASQTYTNHIGSDNPTGSFAGFQYSTTRGDTGWRFTTKDGSTQNLINTGIPYSAGKVYDLYFFCPPYPDNDTIHWRIDNLTDGTTAEGSTTANLPAGATAMRFILGIETRGGGTKSLRWNRIYVESDQ